MNYLIYISTAINLLNDDELTGILKVSRKNNQEHNLTGMLLYGEGTFIQVLEGDEEMLESTYQKIALDKRHKNLIKILTGETAERYFPDWSMGFKTINADALAQIEGFLKPTNQTFNNNDAANVGLKVLKTFAETNRIIS